MSDPKKNYIVQVISQDLVEFSAGSLLWSLNDITKETWVVI